MSVGSAAQEMAANQVSAVVKSKNGQTAESCEEKLIIYPDENYRMQAKTPHFP
jgi:hypothetical protein